MISLEVEMWKISNHVILIDMWKIIDNCLVWLPTRPYHGKVGSLDSGMKDTFNISSNSYNFLGRSQSRRNFATVCRCWGSRPQSSRIWTRYLCLLVDISVLVLLNWQKCERFLLAARLKVFFFFFGYDKFA